MVFASLAVTPACGSDDDDPVDPNRPGNVDPSTPVSDPVGTVVMRMRNDNETKLGQMIVSPENNFTCNSGMIASIGPVAGLGNITDIPLTGWSDKVAVTIGNGYVYYDGNQYYRIYAVQWLKEAGVADAIIGVELKYQSPFKGVDEDLIPETQALSFSDDGGTDEIRFTNTSVIPFTVTSDESWCTVRRWASNDKLESFLYDGISVTVTPNADMEETRAKITIQTLYGKRTIINVTRSGQAPSILFANGESESSREEVSANGLSETAYLTTNVEPEDFQAVSSVDWIVVDNVAKAPEARSMRNTTLRYTILPNYTSAVRQGKISLSSKKGEKTSVLTISQNAGEMTAQEPREVAAATATATVNFTTNVGGTYNISSSAGWCKVLRETTEVNVTGSTRTFSVNVELEPNRAETDRKVIITAKSASGALKADAEITQKGVSFADVPQTVYFNKDRQSLTVTLPVADLVARCDASWCQPIVQGSKLSIRVDAASADRTAVITFENSTAKISVDQSKYAVGDTYSEKGVEGIVCLMEGATRLVRSQLLGQAAYSTENFQTYATDPDNGMANMTKIKALSSWQTYYPAFALCDALNTDGITGWYLPASGERFGLTCWSSTEYDDNEAWYISNRNNYISQKSVARDVYAVHQFVK